MTRVFGSYEIVTASQTTLNSADITVQAPTGKKVVGGGADFPTWGHLVKSAPVNGGAAWQIKVNNTLAGSDQITVTAYAVCADVD